ELGVRLEAAWTPRSNNVSAGAGFGAFPRGNLKQRTERGETLGGPHHGRLRANAAMSADEGGVCRSAASPKRRFRYGDCPGNGESHCADRKVDLADTQAPSSNMSHSEAALVR